MRHLMIFTTGLAAVALLLGTTGCPSDSGDDGAYVPPTTNGGGDHGHSHDAPGPAGGHILAIGDEEYHVEWVHDEDDEELITFIVRDEMAKEEVPIDAEKLTLEMTTVDDAGKETTLSKEIAAVGRTDENPKTAKFELTDRIAIQNLLAGDENTTIVLKITIDGVPYEAEIEHAGGHGHSHSH